MREGSLQRRSHIAGIDLAEATAKTLDNVIAWVPTVTDTLPAEMRAMAWMIIAEFEEMRRRLLQLGLGYLPLDRASATLSTGERQRVQLARAVRNQTTGILYVLDEPSIGLHPANSDGLIGVILILVDHDVQVLREADWMIEIGPSSGTDGGRILTQRTIDTITADPTSRIGPFLSGNASPVIGKRATAANVFDHGALHLHTRPVHTVHALEASIPKVRLTAITGVFVRARPRSCSTA